MGRYFDVRKPFRKEDERWIDTDFPDAPKAAQDHVEWGDHAALTIEEATALSYTLSPLEIRGYLNNPDNDLFTVQDILHARREVIERAVLAGKIKHLDSDPQYILTEDVLRFFEENDETTSDKLKSSLPEPKSPPPIAEPPTAETIRPAKSTHQDEIHNRSKQSVYQIIAALWKLQYGSGGDIDEVLENGVKEFMDEAQGYSLPDERTIKKHLEKALSATDE